MTRRKKKFSPLFLVLFAVLLLYAVLLIVLLAWGLVTSVRDNLGFIENPFSFQGGLKFGNYLTVFLHFKKTVSLSGGG
ncbi:MAG: hypothetical protein ACI4ST_05980, partial [Candidatus Gallimonas sp.]